jgi:hypothetical protein
VGQGPALIYILKEEKEEKTKMFIYAVVCAQYRSQSHQKMHWCRAAEKFSSPHNGVAETLLRITKTLANCGCDKVGWWVQLNRRFWCCWVGDPMFECMPR